MNNQSRLAAITPKALGLGLLCSCVIAGIILAMTTPSMNNRRDELRCKRAYVDLELQSTNG